jgi:CheY-like chemotaxis protein
MPLPAESHDVQAALDELHTRLQEIVGYGSIIVGCTPEGDMLREFTGYIMASAERAQQMGMLLNQRLIQLNELLATLPAEFSGTPGLSNRLSMDIAVPPDPHAAAAYHADPQSSSDTVFDFGEISVSNPEGQKELILVIDHDERSRTLAEVLLTTDDYRVIVCANGFRALDIYRQAGGAIDLVIIEVLMPQIGGEEIFDEIRCMRPDAAVVVSGGFSEPAKVSEMLMKGLNGFIPKPYRQDKLLQQVEAVLTRRRRIAPEVPEGS